MSSNRPPQNVSSPKEMTTSPNQFMTGIGIMGGPPLFPIDPTNPSVRTQQQDLLYSTPTWSESTSKNPPHPSLSYSHGHSHPHDHDQDTSSRFMGTKPTPDTASDDHPSTTAHPSTAHSVHEINPKEWEQLQRSSDETLSSFSPDVVLASTNEIPSNIVDPPSQDWRTLS